MTGTPKPETTPKPPLTMVGRPDAAACTDDSCELPT